MRLLRNEPPFLILVHFSKSESKQSFVELELGRGTDVKVVLDFYWNVGPEYVHRDGFRGDPFGDLLEVVEVLWIV